MMNRAISGGYPPASTFKVMSAVAMLKAGGALNGTYDCPSSYTIGGRQFRNFQGQAHGRVSLAKALEVSCSTIFYEAAYQSWLAQGGTRASDDAADPFISTARSFVSPASQNSLIRASRKTS